LGRPQNMSSLCWPSYFSIHIILMRLHSVIFPSSVYYWYGPVRPKRNKIEHKVELYVSIQRAVGLCNVYAGDWYIQLGRRPRRDWEHVQFQRPAHNGSVQHTVDRAELSQHVHVLALLRLRVSHLSASTRNERKVGRCNITNETTQHDLIWFCGSTAGCRTYDGEVVGSTPGQVFIKWLLVTTWIGDCLRTGKRSSYITNTKVNLAFHPSGASKWLSTFGGTVLFVWG